MIVTGVAEVFLVIFNPDEIEGFSNDTGIHLCMRNNSRHFACTILNMEEGEFRGLGLIGCGMMGGRSHRSQLLEKACGGDSCLIGSGCLGKPVRMENCPMDGDKDAGDWNLAFNPDSWEPAHQIVQELDPMVQFDDWSTKMFHVHGKDATRIPGNGITAWDKVFHSLRESGYSGSVDIEGFHDTDWNGDNEISGQLRSLGYLRACRDGILSGPNWIGEDIHR